MKTCRGFEVQHFKDDYNIDCSIQESSCVEPHIWLGVHNAAVKVMEKDKDVVTITNDDPATNEWGWCTINLPKNTLIESRMHLNITQAKELAKKLTFFAKHGYLQEEAND